MALVINAKPESDCDLLLHCRSPNLTDFLVEIGNARYVATKKRRISWLLLPRILRQIIPGFLYSLSDAVFGW